MPRAKVVAERRFFPYSPFLESANHFCGLMKSGECVYWHDLLAATTLLALSVEALANTAGELLIPSFGDFESSSPKAKIRLICEATSIPYNPQKSPFAEVLYLLKVRNQIAHPKFQELRYESSEMPISEAQDHYAKFAAPLHPLEKVLTPEFAHQSLFAVSSLRDMLMGAVEPDKRFQVSKKELVVKEGAPE
jgi:hypothetical protein